MQPAAEKQVLGWGEFDWGMEEVSKALKKMQFIIAAGRSRVRLPRMLASTPRQRAVTRAFGLRGVKPPNCHTCVWVDLRKVAGSERSAYVGPPRK